MMRHRFPNERLLRIGAWALAGITGSAALLSNVNEPAAESMPTPEGATTESPSVAGTPRLPDGGLTILRVAPEATVPDPPSVPRAPTPSQTDQAQPSTAAQPAPPPPPLSAAPAPIQSSGS